jgi:hypothetical protein
MNVFSLIRQVFRPKPSPADKSFRWRVAGCSRPGTAHLRRGRGCEDSIGWILQDDLLLIAAADGAGSAAHPKLGSVLTVRSALTDLWNHHTSVCPVTAGTATKALTSACQNTLNCLAARASEIAAEPRDLATTLILVVADRSFVAAAQVGDGAVVVKDDEGNLISLTTPTNGEFANETILLGCSQNIDVKIRSLPNKSSDVIRLKSIAIFTDGIQRMALKLPLGDPHPPFFTPLFDQFERLTESDMENLLGDFLDSPRVNARTDDDKTIAVAHLP